MIPRVVLVTGGSSGIGEATALRAADRGDHVVLVARGESSLKRVAEECERLGAASATVLPADVSDDDAVARVVQETVRRLGRVDVAVSAAAVVAYGRIGDVPTEVFDQVLRTNLHGAANVARHVLPVLREQGSGSLVLVGSVVGHVATPEMTSYVVSKWAVRALARQLAIEVRDEPGVTVGYVAPGGVDTPIYEHAANFGALSGRPPFPVIGPDPVARRILDLADGRRVGSQVGPANHLLRLGFTVLPRVYDAIVGPAFRILAADLQRSVEPGPGNVLAPDEDRNALRAGWTNDPRVVLRNVATLLRDATGRGDP